MKFSILFIFAFILLSCSTKQQFSYNNELLVGKYKAEQDKISFVLELNENQSYTYTEFFDLCGAESHGNWSIKNNQIQLSAAPDTLNLLFRAIGFRYYKKLNPISIVNSDTLIWNAQNSPKKIALMLIRM